METSLRVAICDDDSVERAVLERHVTHSPVPAACTLYSSAEELLEEYYVGKYDLIVMDIYMDGLDGVAAVNRLREVDPSVPVAFATSSKEYALEGFRMGVFYYLEKPVTQKAVADLMERARAAQAFVPHLEFAMDKSICRIPYSRVMYVEQNRNDLILYLEDGTQCRMPERIEDAAQQFEQNGFFRPHKSYLVNPNYVEELDIGLMVFRMKGDGQVHITRRKLPDARKLQKEKQFKLTETELL